MHRNNSDKLQIASLYFCGFWLLVMFGAIGWGIAQNHRSQFHHLKWTAESVEYAALCSQGWRVGKERIVEYLKTHDGRFVVGLDLDEVVILNVQYNIEHESYHDDTWLTWVESGKSLLVPGAKEFLNWLHNLPQVQIVFISNRWGREREATERFMRKHDLLRDGDLLMMRESPDDSKEVRRKEIEQGTGRCKQIGPLPIAILFGDQISDFYPIRGKQQAAAERIKAATDPRWGREFIIFPNPVYGAWERDYP